MPRVIYTQMLLTGGIIIYLWGLRFYRTGPPLSHGFFAFLCHNAVPKPYVVASVSNMRSSEIQENQDRSGHEGFLEFQKSFIAFRRPEKCFPVFTKCVQFFQDPVKSPNELCVMAEHYKALHISKAGNLADSAVLFCFYRWKFPLC